jgi:hypothetical protein
MANVTIDIVENLERKELVRMTVFGDEGDTAHVLLDIKEAQFIANMLLQSAQEIAPTSMH